MSARGINKVILVGRLGNDPEVRYIPNGGAVANLQVATSESWRDKQTGEMREQTEWHRVVLFGKLAEVAGEYLRKGAQVYIEGQLRTRSWEDNGITRYVTEILVKTTGTMQMLGSAPQQNAQAQPKPQQNGQPQSADATKKGGAKTKGRGRKAAQPEPQPQPPEGEDYGFSVANLQVATSETWRDKQTGEMREQTEWHRVVLFGKLAEVAGEYLRKGAQVYIEGQLRTRSWEDNGITRYVTEILVKTTGTMQMLGRAAGAQTQPEEGQQFSGQPQPEPQSEAGTKKGGAKTKGRGRKAAQPEPQPQPPEGEDYGFSDDIPF